MCIPVTNTSLNYICNKNMYLRRRGKPIEGLRARQSYLEPLVEHLNCNELKMGCGPGEWLYFYRRLGRLQDTRCYYIYEMFAPRLIWNLDALKDSLQQY
jgi:hypothetical protein